MPYFSSSVPFVTQTWCYKAGASYRDSPGISPSSDSREVVRHELEDSALVFAVFTRQPTVGDGHGVVFHRVVARLMFSEGQSVVREELIKTGLSNISAPLL